MPRFEVSPVVQAATASLWSPYVKVVNQQTNVGNDAFRTHHSYKTRSDVCIESRSQLRTSKFRLRWWVLRFLTGSFSTTRCGGCARVHICIRGSTSESSLVKNSIAVVVIIVIIRKARFDVDLSTLPFPFILLSALTRLPLPTRQLPQSTSVRKDRFVPLLLPEVVIPLRLELLGVLQPVLLYPAN